jgi:hypothetical protein
MMMRKKINASNRLNLLHLLGVMEAKFLAKINDECGDPGKN